MQIKRETIKETSEVQVTITLTESELSDLTESLNAGMWGDSYPDADETVRLFLEAADYNFS